MKKHLMLFATILLASVAFGQSIYQQTQARPISLGTSGGNVNDISHAFCCSGTLGSLVTKGGTQYILSNNHVLARCTLQKRHVISRDSFFQPIFMVQPAENIFGPDPGGCWQFTPLKFRSREWFPTKIGNAWPQAGVWSSVIVVGNPLPQDRSKMPLI